jgi:hypothetical protein
VTLAGWLAAHALPPPRPTEISDRLARTCGFDPFETPPPWRRFRDLPAATGEALLAWLRELPEFAADGYDRK